MIGMKFSQREIVLLPFPYSDLTTVKRRPVLILSNDTYNNKHEDIVVAAITSNIYSDAYSIELDSEDLEYGLMPEKSSIKVGKLFSASKNSIVKKFSLIKREKFDEVVSMIHNLLAPTNED